MTDNARDKKKRMSKIFLMISLGIIGVNVMGFVVFLAYFVSGLCSINAMSLLEIKNHAGFDVRFQKIIVDDEVIWGTSYPVESTKSRGMLRYDQRGHIAWFEAGRGSVELQVVTINDLGESETVRCTLDNRQRPCFFTVTYVKGRLFCRARPGPPSLVPGL